MDQAEIHFADHGFYASKMLLFLYLNQRLSQAGKTSPKAEATQSWIDSVLFTENLSNPPYEFSEIVQEICDILNEPEDN
ncbi:MAG: hypothetical protein IAE97_13645 [Chthoniobacterales bacterium]|nr:hypothetical protein [Chthoniobacterales bacterium]